MKKSMIILLCFVFFISFANAKISISGVNEVYNFGDRIPVTLTLNTAKISGIFSISLNCANESVDVYKISPAEGHFTSGEEQIVTHNILLLPEFINSLSGSCNILAQLGDEKISTKNFILTGEINIKAEINKLNYNPGEAIKLTIKATKANGSPLNGFIEVSNATDFAKAIVGGNILEVFSMPETIEAGDYVLNILVYDEERINSASSSVSFKINSVASSIEISLSSIDVEPGKIFDFGINLYDQSGIEMQGAVSVSAKSPKGEEKQISVESGQTGTFEFGANATPGTWMLLASFDNVDDEKEFNILAVPKVSFDFIDTVLVIKNIGNSAYNKTINIKIGEETKELNLNILPGEERKFNLKAPDGEYNVVVSDDSNSVEKTLNLIGRAVSINDLKGLSLFSKYPIVWVLIIAILGSIATILYFKFKKKTFRLKDKMKDISSKLSFKRKEENYEQALDSDKDKGMIDITKSEVSEAESSLILKGEKHLSSIVVLRVYNLNNLTDEARKQLAKLLSTARKNKGMVELKGDYMMIIFSPLTTKTFNNEVLAAKTGQEILKELETHNKRFKDKIDFNIGLNSGDLISNIEKGKLMYTSIGNTILLAKKIADSDHGKLLVPSEFRKKIMRDLKVEKEGSIGKQDIYSVLKITDKEANQDKLKDILKRMGRE